MTLWILIGVTVVGSLYSITQKRELDGGWRAAWWFILPSLIGFLAFFLIPTIRGVYLSFTDWSILQNDGEFIGLDNYRTLWDDARFRDSMWTTARYVLINIGTQTILAILLAIMMDRLTRSSVVRTLILLPWLIPNLVAALLFVWLLDPSLGVANDVLEWLGLGRFNFFQSPSGVIPTVAALNTWKFMGYTALLLFAGLQTIPSNLYEAAALDGASEWAMARNITIPLMRPVLALVMVVTVVGSFQVFDTVQVATGGFNGDPGGPSGFEDGRTIRRSEVIYLYIYDTAFVKTRVGFMGYAATMASVLLVFLLAVTAIQFRLFRANESDLAS